MYDVYRHVDRKTGLLIVPEGAGLPKNAAAAKWTLYATRKVVSKLVANEIDRTGYCVTRPKTQSPR